MRKLRIGLLPKIILAILLGIGFGNLFSFPFIRIFVTFNAIFSELLGFSIPLIILGLVTVAIADIGKGAGKILLITVLILTRLRSYRDSLPISPERPSSRL